LEAAVRADDKQQLRRLSEGLGSAVFDNGAFTNELLNQLTRIIQSEAYAKMSDGLLLMRVFEYNLNLLTDSQRDKLGSAIVAYVPCARDAIAAFLAVEIIAEIWKDRRSIEAIILVKERARTEETFALVTHGFDWLAKRTSDTGVRVECLDQLDKLSRHPSSAVRVEALAALTRLRRVG
jgi:hypothetical protein